MRYGYTQAQWDAAVDAGVRILKDVAGLGPSYGTISYTDLCERIFAICDVRVVPGEFALPELLGDISAGDARIRQLRHHGHLVVYKDSVDAGKGLYALAIAEGLRSKNPREDEQDRFRTQNMNLAYERWPRQRHVPGARFRRTST